MSVRGGRGPREDMAAPVSDGGGKRPNGYQRTGRYGRGPGDQRRYDGYGDRRGGMRGLFGFVVFLAVLAAIVMFALLTIARPIARLAIVPLVEDNPRALQIGFLADLVREDLGASLTAPAGGGADEIVFTVKEGDTPATIAPRLAEAGIIDERAGVPVPGAHGRPRPEAHGRQLRAGGQPHAGRRSSAVWWTTGW